MTATVLVVCLMLGSARALVDLKCSDNATCIENLGKDLVQSLREQKAVRLFDIVTIEPLSRRQGRSSGGIWGMMEDHALSFDWGDYTFRISVPQDGRDDALDLELYESRAVKEEPDPSPKKSSSKVEDEKEDEPPKAKGPIRRRRRQKKKVMQALIPLMFGMKSAGVVIFAFALVTVLTLKAFMASKTALLVTIAMAAKRLYDNYSTGVGIQNHPYLYSQYPIDFPSASSHAYSVSGVSPQFASNEMYSPNMLGANAQEYMQQQDASAQQSQQAPLLVNSTQAAERWDGKSKIRKFFEPILDSFKTVINPIANIFYGAIPTFRGRNTEAEVSTEGIDANTIEEEVKKPREFLLPQPRFFAQRKNFVKTRNTPKKHTELRIDLDKLKHNKDFIEYIKTKKYKYNYPNTLYYPRVKYVINPNLYYNNNIKPNNSRFLPHRKSAPHSLRPITPLPPLTTITPTQQTTTTIKASTESSEWKPIAVLVSNITAQNLTNPIKQNLFNISNIKLNPFNITNRQTKRIIRRVILKRPLKPNKRTKRDLYVLKDEPRQDNKRSFLSSIMQFFSKFFSPKPVSKSELVDKTELKLETISTDLAKEHPPLYYSVIYDALMITLDVIEGIYSVHEFALNYFWSDPFSSKFKTTEVTKKRRKYKNKRKPDNKIVELEFDESKVEIIHDNNYKIQDKLVNQTKGETVKDESKDDHSIIKEDKIGNKTKQEELSNKTVNESSKSEDKENNFTTKDEPKTDTLSTESNNSEYQFVSIVKDEAEMNKISNENIKSENTNHVSQDKSEIDKITNEGTLDIEKANEKPVNEDTDKISGTVTPLVETTTAK